MPQRTERGFFSLPDKEDHPKKHINLAEFDPFENQKRAKVRSGGSGFVSFLCFVFFLSAAGLGYLDYYFYNQIEDYKTQLSKSELQIVSGIEEKVKQKIVTPNEKPTITIVDNLDDYKNYTIYGDLKIGDFVLKYEKNKKIIFYNSITNQVIGSTELIARSSSTVTSQVSGLTDKKKEIVKIPFRFIVAKSLIANKTLIEGLKTKLANYASSIDVVEAKFDGYKTLGIYANDPNVDTNLDAISSAIGAEDITLNPLDKPDKAVSVYIVIGSNVK